MARVIAVSNLKGGSAKSTTTIALGACLAELGKNTLLIDMDGQGHLSEGYGIPALSHEHEISEVLDGTLQLSDIVTKIRPRLFLAPSHLRLAHLEPRLINEVGRELRLFKALEQVRGRFDFVLIDCPPSVGIHTVNALRAADEVLIPMSAEFFALVGVSMLFDSLAKIRDGLDHEIRVTGILPTRVNRTAHAREVVEQIENQLGKEYRIFAPIPEAVAVRDAAAAGRPVTEYQPTSPASVAYRKLAEEIANGKKVTRRRSVGRPVPAHRPGITAKPH